MKGLSRGNYHITVKQLYHTYKVSPGGFRQQTRERSGKDDKDCHDKTGMYIDTSLIVALHQRNQIRH